MSGAVERERTLASRYAIQQEIGRGGMGVVYLAYDLRLQHPVAVKFLNRELAGALGGERFIDEIRTNARLRHPHILPVTDSGEIDGELFFVTPFIDGPSLRERLDRGPRFSVAEALRIAREIASALAHVHAHGAVHRDIKPDNVILDAEGNALIADFGLAFVLSRVDSSRLTIAGLTVGSPAYMSPEQAVGEAQLDGRSDIYALGCVLFELLTGEPPFNGGGAQATMRRHIVEPPPSVRRRRADVPASIDRLLEQTLAKDPDDRFPTAQTLAQALDVELARLVAPEAHAPEAAEHIDHRRARLLVRLAAPLALLAVLLWTTRSQIGGLLDFGGAPPDSSKWLVLPLQWRENPTASTGAAEDVLFHDAFARWNGLTLVDRMSLQEVSRSGSRQALSAGFGFDAARHHSAGRYVVGVATDLGDSIHVDVSVLDAMNGSPEVISRVTSRLSRAELADGFALIADSLLFGRVTWDDGPEYDIGTRSFAARLNYAHAHRAISRWELGQADSMLRVALEADPGFTRAKLWLAHSRNWMDEDPDRWVQLAAEAAADSAELTSREAILATALTALGSADYDSACAGYRRILERGDQDFAGWYGLGECQRLDRRVVTDASSPSGFRFNTGRAPAFRSYVRAFLIEPASLSAFRSGSFLRLRDLFMTRINDSWSGEDAGGSLFIARAEWRGDSLSLVPVRWVGTALPERDPGPHREAVRRQQRMLLRVCEAWVAANPRNPDALHALALAQEVNGDAHALATLAQARALESSAASRRELDIRFVWATLKFATHDAVQLARARTVADSLLLEAPSTDRQTAAALASIAVLLGRPAEAARWARTSTSTVEADANLPPAVARPALALLAFAAVGGPADSISVLAQRVRGAMGRALAPGQQALATSDFERRYFILGPQLTGQMVAESRSVLNPLARAWAALAAGDTAQATSIARALANRRPGAVSAGSITPDVLYSEAALFAATGDTASAIRWLDPTLEELEWLQPGVLDELGNAGAIVRAMALRAEIAAQRGDTSTARRWAVVVVNLWSGGENAADPLVVRMRSLLPRSTT